MCELCALIEYDVEVYVCKEKCEYQFVVCLWLGDLTQFNSSFFGVSSKTMSPFDNLCRFVSCLGNMYINTESPLYLSLRLCTLACKSKPRVLNFLGLVSKTLYSIIHIVSLILIVVFPILGFSYKNLVFMCFVFIVSYFIVLGWLKIINKCLWLNKI